MRYAHAKHTFVNRSILVHVAIFAANLQYYLLGKLSLLDYQLYICLALLSLLPYSCHTHE